MTSTAALRFARVARGCDRLPVYRRKGAGQPVLAAELRGEFDPDRTPADGVGGQAPFGLPVLAELPELAGVLRHLAAADAALLDAVTGLAALLEGETVEHTTGVGVEHWLAAVAAQTRMDRRLLLRACRLLHRLPTLRGAVAAHRVSFAQLRGLTIALRQAPKKLDERVDELIGVLIDALDSYQNPDPDVLIRQVTDALDELDAADLKAREQTATQYQSLFLQPNLDGTGGRAVAELDATGLAFLDAVTTPTPQLVEAAGGYGAARAQLLLARLAAADPAAADPAADAAPATDAGGMTPATDDGGVASEAALPGGITVDPDGGIDWHAALPASQLLLRVPFEALLDDTIPTDLLTRLVGGRLRLTAPAARRLLDATGAKLRMIIHDTDGTVLGVGRSSRQPPGWLADTIAAIHDTCTGPACDRSARGRELDHAQPWWPDPDQPGGTTDLDNLGPLCATTNRTKEAAGWRISQRASGTRTWTHTRSGVVTTSIPNTWRPPNDPRRRWRSADTANQHGTNGVDRPDPDHDLPF